VVRSFPSTPDVRQHGATAALRTFIAELLLLLDQVRATDHASGDGAAQLLQKLNGLDCRLLQSGDKVSGSVRCRTDRSAGSRMSATDLAGRSEGTVDIEQRDDLLWGSHFARMQMESFCGADQVSKAIHFTALTAEGASIWRSRRCPRACAHVAARASVISVDCDKLRSFRRHKLVELRILFNLR
jgi:hypothetical protein